MIQPDVFFDNGRLKKPVSDWLHTAMGFDLDVIHNTRFMKAKKLPYHARTFYKTVWYLDPSIESNATHGYSLRDWLNLIAHEMYHRQEIGNHLFSAARLGISYGFYWVRNWMKGKDPYRDNPHEIRAYAMGCGHCSQVDEWLRKNPDFLNDVGA